ncbi:hypothetical protein WR25_12356 [Diploscapter pachys]|uniref:Uncharacterized protein n=1 Tax=Diploscapter pachys TaxID=2018661 RepID=A0A2A2M4M1_9BILA|nr:hypothetical protein WR25_12356 [Diploscapter pachys]
MRRLAPHAARDQSALQRQRHEIVARIGRREPVRDIGGEAEAVVEGRFAEREAEHDTRRLQLLDPGGDQRLCHALPPPFRRDGERGQRDRGNGLAADVDPHPAERDEPGERTVDLGDEDEHHVALHAQVADQRRLVGRRETVAQQRVDRGDVAAGGGADRRHHASAMSGASSAFMPMTL